MASSAYTREVFENFEKSELYVLPRVCMKNMNRSEYGKSQFAIISSDNIIENKLILIDRGTQSETVFDTIDDMLEAGWVID